MLCAELTRFLCGGRRSEVNPVVKAVTDVSLERIII